ncbi:MAG: transposase [Methylacidiphilaceae bacterium]|nr:transposase [Candidatus Methylacidiphilaceae bacterium]
MRALAPRGRSILEVARDLGVSRGSLNRWAKDAQVGRAFSDPKTWSAEWPKQRELRRLRQENDYLRCQHNKQGYPNFVIDLLNLCIT